MALLTPLPLDLAREVCDAHQLGELLRVEPLAAGSVNSNFFLHTDRGRSFARIYEEADDQGVAFERALVDHLLAAGVSVPRRVRASRELRVAGKPVGVFEAVAGHERCRREVTSLHLSAVGEALARVHLAGDSFGLEQRSRFDAPALLARLDGVPTERHPELRDDLSRVRAVLADPLPELRRGVVHGDLFRDNVRWEGDRVLCLLDWDSASTGPTLYDLAVTWLAWTFGDDFDWATGRALVTAYDSLRPLTEAEREGFSAVARLACARFAATRVTDYHLRLGPGAPGYRDYRRFLARLDVIEALSPRSLMGRLL